MLYYHVTESKNLERIMKEGLIPQSGPRSEALGDYGVFLFNNLDSLEDGVSNWLGDLFDEEEELVILEVSIPENIILYTNDLVGYESYVEDCIPSEYINVYYNSKFTL